MTSKKQDLRQIYDALSSGRLDRDEALARIRALGQGEDAGDGEPLLAVEGWAPAALVSDSGESDDPAATYAMRRVVLCELPDIDTDTLSRLLPGAVCTVLRAAPGQAVHRRFLAHALTCFEQVKTMLAARAQGRMLLQIVIPEDGSGRGETMLFDGLSGLLRTAALENPHFVGQLIRVPATLPAATLADCLRSEATQAGAVLRVRHGDRGRELPRWQEVPHAAADVPQAWRDGAVYLITGGLGGLGRLFAQDILRRAHGATVVLTGRGALDAQREAALRAFAIGDGRVVYRQVDLEDAASVDALIASITGEFGRLDGILHGAGAIADNFLLKKSADEFARVLGPKVLGTWHLDAATRALPLDLFALFSSIASAFGNVGQADYAAANAFMDAFAAHRNARVAAGERRGRTVAIDWSLWRDGGMTIDASTLDGIVRSTGMRPMRTETGLAAFHRSVALNADRTIAMAGDLARMRALLAGGTFPRTDASTASAPAHASVVSSAPVEAGDLARRAEDWLRRELAGVLKLPAERIDPQAGLERYGIDSILAMQLTNRLEQTFGSLSKTLFFEYQTLRELAGHFAEQHAPRLQTLFATSAPADASTPAPASLPARATEPVVPSSTRGGLRGRLRRTSTSGAMPTATAPERIATRRAPTDPADPIAIVGLSGRYPEAIDIEAYWRNLREGRDCIVEVPEDRWDWRRYYSEDRTASGRHFSKWGGFIAGVDEFDPQFFNISPKEAKLIDPQERLFLQHAWMAIEDAGYTREGLQFAEEGDQPGQVGVYAGLMFTEYQLFGAEASLRGTPLGVPVSAASIANRVSYALNLHGPSMTVDTMCSSSLTAIHLACQDLQSGRIRMALAGGVNVSIHPNKYLVLSAGQFISSDGHCQSFGEGGDGYIPGEGVGVVVLKRLSDAERDGDQVYGLIRGSALNHGGKTNGYTVPNPQAQAAVIGRALADSGIDARRIGYIEAHGTGTKLGDPIEIAALGKAFAKYTQETGFCLIGSAKSNIGHCESAAGIAGLTKVLLQLKHRQIVPSLHSSRLNPHIDFAKTPFVVNQTLREWPAPEVDGRVWPRLAGLSSFGAGGSNAHLLVEEYVAPETAPVVHAQVAVVLSARTAEQLRQKAVDLLAFVRDREHVDLTALAYTLQIGREAMDERVGVVVSTEAQLTSVLEAFVSGEEVLEGGHRGQARRNREALSLFGSDGDLRQAVEKWIAGGKLDRLVELWTKGLEVDWRALYGAARPRRMSLPTYPFAKERYWIDATLVAQASAPGGTARLHSLLHENVSDLQGQRYASRFGGEEPLLRDHVVATADGARRALPAMALLEMARAAAEHAQPARAEGTVPELRDAVWAQPLVVAGETRVDVGLQPGRDGGVDYEIACTRDGTETIHAQGAVHVVAAQARMLDLGGLRARMTRDALSSEAVYAQCERLGLTCGPRLRTVSALRRGVGEALVELRLPAGGAEADQTLSPTLLEGALHGAQAWLAAEGLQDRLPFAVARLRVLSACGPEMFAWLRFADGADMQDATLRLDVDLCDAQGRVCIELRGCVWSPVTMSAPAPEMPMPPVHLAPSMPASVVSSVEEVTGTIKAPAAPKRIAFLAPAATLVAAADVGVDVVPVERMKPTSIALADVEALPSTNTPAARVSVALSVLTDTTGMADMPGGDATTESAVELFDCGEGHYTIRIDDGAGDGNRLSDTLIEHLLQALDRVRSAEPKVLTLEGAAYGFLRGGRRECDRAIERGLFRAIAACPCPTIAVAQGDARGAGLLVALLCDLLVLGEDARYGYVDGDLWPGAAELSLCAARLGTPLAEDLLYATTTASGAELRARGWTCAVTSEASAQARTWVESLLSKSTLSLSLLKAHLSRDPASLAAALTPASAAIDAKTAIGAKRVAKALPSSRHLQVGTAGEGVLSIRLRAVQRKPAAKELLADLDTLFDRLGNGSAHQGAAHRAVVLSSEDPAFLPAAVAALPESALLRLCERIVALRVPVVAALEGDARGPAWWLAAVCDAAVHADEGRYASAGIESVPALRMALSVSVPRFGDEAARDLLLSGEDATGAALRARAPALRTAPARDVLATATALAAHWATAPAQTLTAWKTARAAEIEARIASLSAMPFDSAIDRAEVGPAGPAAGPVPLPLASSVVSATAYPDGVVVVAMADREARNMFSDAFMAGVEEAFARIEASPAHRVVVLTGYDRYFSSGGTRENLLAIQRGDTTFADHRVFEAAARCSLPVIAAMQGHGIGAGWTLGMFADVALLGEDGRYLSPYMNYGFTPGAGATWVLAARMGRDLANEGLLTAQPLTGAEMRARGLRMRVLPRADILDAALSLARAIARAPQPRSRLLKHWWTGLQREAREATYRAELVMHERTFVGQADTLARIEREFHADVESAAAQTVSAPAVEAAVMPAIVSTPVSAPVSSTAVSSSSVEVALDAIVSTLRTLLSQELQLDESGIDEHAQFIDLGLDSISGVTWIRKINAHYGTSIEATKVYAHPTLAGLGRHLRDVLQPATLPSPPVPVETTPAAASTASAPTVSASAIGAAVNEVVAVLRTLLSQELQLDESGIDEHAQFIDLGLDSISGVTWIRRINAHYDTAIEATKVYAHPTLFQLARHVADALAQRAGTSPAQVAMAVVAAVDAVAAAPAMPVPQPAPATAPAAARGTAAIHPAFAVAPLVSRHRRAGARVTAAASQAAIAVIGMAGQFPQSADVDAFWRNIAEGRDCMSPVAPERWDPERYYRPGAPTPGKTYCRWLGALEDYDRFDPLFFGISPREAESMDPQQRLFLQACWHTIEHAGYDARALSGSRCGVFVGCAAGDYRLLSREQQISALGFTGDASSILAARIAYFLDLQGPCVSIDTACSSSLVAIASACDSLVSGASDLALAGGVYVMAGPDMHIKTCQGGMLSPEGRCFSFDHRADGFALGEGVGAILLKRLDDAERDEDTILGVIEGWGVNQDGRTNGITAPNPESQTRLEREVYARFGIDPAGIQLIEAHGTGTALGDPIEVEALKQAFAHHTREVGYCALGSVKSNIGHCLTAAGVAGTIKLLLAIRHRQLPPTIHFEALNEHIRLDGSPFYINDRLQPWQPGNGARRRAAVSSFGFSGTNAHLVIAEPASPTRARSPVSALTEAGKVAVPLSAKTPERLRDMARNLLAFLRGDGAELDPLEIAYTLQVGREPMEERVAFLVDSVAQLCERLQAWIDGDARIEDCHQGQTRRSRESISLLSRDEEMKLAIVDKYLAQRRLGRLLELWVRGLEFDWRRLYGATRPQRIALPGYPFARERYWIEAGAEADADARDRSSPHAAVLHPLLHANVSDFDRQRYRSVFAGDASVLDEHGGLRTLSAMACAAMARAAVAHACADRLAEDRGTVLELQALRWAPSQIPATGEPGIEIRLSRDSDGGVEFDIVRGGDEAAPVLCQGRVAFVADASPTLLDLAASRAAMSEVALDADASKTLRSLHLGEGRALAMLRATAEASSTADGFDPTRLQTALAVVSRLTGAPVQPAMLASLRVSASWPNEGVVSVRQAREDGTFDLDLCDVDGRVCVALRGLALSAATVVQENVVRVVDQTVAADDADRLLAVPAWQPRAIAPVADSADAAFATHHVLLCEMTELDAAALQAALPNTVCVSATGDPSAPIAARYAAHALDAFAQVQALQSAMAQADATRGRALLQIVVPDAGEQTLFAGLSGLLRSAMLETPNLTAQLILVPPQTGIATLAGHLRAERVAGAHEPLLRQGEAGRAVPRWARVGPADPSPPAFRDGGVYLITGGLGGLGLLFAREILARTADARVVLTGRGEIDATQAGRLEALAAHGGVATYRRMDPADAAQTRDTIAAVRAEFGRLDGILHSAGMIADNLVSRKSAEEFARVLAPKVAGTVHLDDATRDLDLDWFVLFSSIAATMGFVGQTDYAAANGFMDAFAAHRNRLVASGQRKGRTRSIAWPLWRDGGMAVDAAKIELVAQTTGMRPIDAAAGFDAFHRSLALDADRTLVLAGDARLLRAHLERARLFDAETMAVAASTGAASTGAASTAAASMAAVDEAALQQALKTRLSAVLRIDPARIDLDQSFSEIGLDSFLGVELIVAINRDYGIALSNSRVYDYPTVRALAALLAQEIAASRPAVAVSVPASVAEPVVPTMPTAQGQVAALSPRTHRKGLVSAAFSAPAGDERIAIVGMAGRYPQADDLDAFWTNLVASRNAVVEVPASRWDVGRYYDPDPTKPGRTVSKWLGAIDDVDCFDPLFFRISPQEAERMDPQHRLFLQEAYRAFEDAGYAGQSLSNRRCGVYLGMSTNEYALLLARHGALSSATVTSNSDAIGAARIAYYLNLKGPAISVDTACSSSLVAVHLACQGLLRGETDLALAGGATLWLVPDSYLAMSAAGMFSLGGQCRTFSEGADGIVNGDGVGALVLKRLADAERDGDHIHGVILGSGINQDGKTNGITAPSVNSQIELERSVYARCGIDPATIGYVEAHGTGTRLGDPIELEALATVFRESTDRKGFCAIGSVKSNLGHTTSAAGVAGVQKVLLSMRHRTLVPTLHADTPTSRFDFADSPFVLSRETREWTVAPGARRRAAVSSFGFSGTNAHLVIEEYPVEAAPARAATPPGTSFAMPLSARTEAQLRRKAADLAAFLRGPGATADPAEVAYTLQVGRDAMEERLGLVAGSVAELAEALEAWLRDGNNSATAARGRVERGQEGLALIDRDEDMQEAIDKWVSRNKSGKLLALWVKGLSFDWTRLHRGRTPRRTSLPGYPFARERYWVPAADDPAPASAAHVAVPGGEREADAHAHAIEDIVERLESDAIGTAQAVRMLRMLV